MPASERAELSAELKVVFGGGAENPVDAAMQAAGETGLAHEAGPETIVLAGDRDEVLGGTLDAIRAALDAGASAVEVRVERAPDAPRFEGARGR